MNQSTQRLQRLCVMALLCALAFVTVATVRIPVIIFLKYEPKDVLLAIGGFLFGPLAGALMCAATALAELTVSDTGLIGMVMNILSSCLFVCTAGAIYRRKKTLARAVIGLICGAVAMTGGMLLWNYLITPLYMGVTREEIAGLLLPAFLPFNLLKSGLNAALTVLLYKGVSSALRAAHLLPAPPAADAAGKKRVPAWPFALIAVIILAAIMYAVSSK